MKTYKVKFHDEYGEETAYFRTEETEYTELHDIAVQEISEQYETLGYIYIESIECIDTDEEPETYINTFEDMMHDAGMKLSDFM